MEYNFRYKLTEEDYAEYNAYTAWHASWQKKVRLTYSIRVFIYGGVSMIATFIILSKVSPQKNNNYKILAITAAFLNLLITWVYYNKAPFSIKSKAKKILRKEDNHHFLDDTELNINESNIISTGKLNTTKYSWESIVRYATTEEYFYLYISTIQALVIPKRLLKDKNEIETFDKFLTGKIPLSSSFRSIGE